MKFEKIGSIGYKKGFLYGIIITLVFVVVINLFTSLAKYRLTESVKIVDSVVSYSPYDFKIMEIYKQKEDSKCTDKDGDCYEKLSGTDRMPSDGYVLNSENSHCELNTGGKDNEAKLTSNEAGETVISGLTVRDKCYLYYDREKSAKELIVDNSNYHEGVTPHFDGIACLSGCDYQENGLYETEDDFGESYYFRGTVDDNWVKFGIDSNNQPLWWRIIRINGDGTIRLIYAGSGNNISDKGEETNALLNQTFDANKWDYLSVGYEYQSGQAHGNGTPSNALTQLENWFKDNLEDEWNNGNGKIDKNAGFCNDRTHSDYNYTVWNENNFYDGGDPLYSQFYFGSFLRLSSYKTPTLKCSTKTYKNADFFTYKGAAKGTQSLNYPIGLITADEVAFAGGLHSKINSKYWLYTNQEYWTMSPYMFEASYHESRVFTVYSDGTLIYKSIDSKIGLRPVINLKADTEFTGTGISTDPYVVKNA